MLQKAIGQRDDGLLHRVAQPVTDAAALFDGGLMIVLQPAPIASARDCGKRVRWHQPIEQDELVEPPRLPASASDQIHVRRAREVRRVAQQAQHIAVSHDAPHVLAAIQIILHQPVRRQRPAPRCRPAPQLLSVPTMCTGTPSSPSSPSPFPCPLNGGTAGREGRGLG